ncbi:MAG: hypothetical protein AAGI38_12160 [Bacteroidota bacterium]
MKTLTAFLLLFGFFQAGVAQISPPTHINGKPMAVGAYIVDSTERILIKNGQWEFYYDNGNLSSKGTYDSGQKVGEWVTYNYLGKIESRGFYCYDSLVDVRQMGIEKRKADSISELRTPEDWGFASEYPKDKDSVSLDEWGFEEESSASIPTNSQPKLFSRDYLKKEIIIELIIIELDKTKDSTYIQKISDPKEVSRYADEGAFAGVDEWGFEDVLFVKDLEERIINRKINNQIWYEPQSSKECGTWEVFTYKLPEE